MRRCLLLAEHEHPRARLLEHAVLRDLGELLPAGLRGLAVADVHERGALLVLEDGPVGGEILDDLVVLRAGLRHQSHVLWDGDGSNAPALKAVGSARGGDPRFAWTGYEKNFW